jgi:hypothetical protein
MNVLKKGQRWRFKAPVIAGLIIEVLNPTTGESKVVQQGKSHYTVGREDFFSAALNGAVAGREPNLEYLEGQDSPNV